jgi:hypothetical protein
MFENKGLDKHTLVGDIVSDTCVIQIGYGLILPGPKGNLDALG